MFWSATVHGRWGRTLARSLDKGQWKHGRPRRRGLAAAPLPGSIAAARRHGKMAVARYTTRHVPPRPFKRAVHRRAECCTLRAARIGPKRFIQIVCGLFFVIFFIFFFFFSFWIATRPFRRTTRAFTPSLSFYSWTILSLRYTVFAVLIGVSDRFGLNASVAKTVSAVLTIPFGVWSVENMRSRRGSIY